MRLIYDYDCVKPTLASPRAQAEPVGIVATAVSATSSEGFSSFLWPPYAVGQAIYIFILWFLLLCSFFFFPRLISAVGDWMSTFYTWCGLSANLECRSEMCCMRLAGNTGRKNDAKNRHLGTISQLCRAMSLRLRHVSTI